MFSYVYVCQSVCLSTEGPYVTITHDALDLAVQPPFHSTPPRTSDMGPPSGMYPTGMLPSLKTFSYTNFIGIEMYLNMITLSHNQYNISF